MSTATQKPAAWIVRITARIADRRVDNALSATIR
jgi:hypothetical protein